VIISDNTIDDVWRWAIFECVRNGRDYEIKHGSYIGQKRRQFPYVVLEVNTPWKRPLAVQMPEGSGLPAPTSEEAIHEYFLTSIINDDKGCFDYTYGQYIYPQLERVIEIINSSDGYTNQACITIGDKDSIYLDDPPCLRSITFKRVGEQLNLAVYFRSWDLFAGLPENLGGLQLLKEYILTYLTFPIKDGSIIAFSDGLHLYEMYFPIVNILSAIKIQERRG